MINNGGPIISSTGIDMGSNVDEEECPTNAITNLEKGVNGTDAVNLDQLNEANETANKGWFVRTDLTEQCQGMSLHHVLTANGDAGCVLRRQPPGNETRRTAQKSNLVRRSNTPVQNGRRVSSLPPVADTMKSTLR